MANGGARQSRDCDRNGARQVKLCEGLCKKGSRRALTTEQYLDSGVATFGLRVDALGMVMITCDVCRAFLGKKTRRGLTADN